MATLIGFDEGPDVLPGGTRPDVLRLRTADGALFVADAKATETPGNTETYLRLNHYAEFLTAVIEKGCACVLALAVDVGDAYGWLRVLRGLSFGPSGGKRVTGHLDQIDADTAVIWQSFVRPGRYALPGS
ncbi:hypothetical protein [Nocardia sp. NPDC019304]|uniref:hypothetical protein n=1 Tax=unclassified Nocardia TaxID=2637762 RepID=UPI0033EA4CA0